MHLLNFLNIVALCSALMFAAPAAADEIAYEPMKPFAPFAGKTLRGEGTGPDGKPVVDIAKWEFILGGRALQSTHRLENGSYGGRTIFFYDEAAKKYVFHYFTTAGFHTTGEAYVTPTGFQTVEKVIGHDRFAEVRAEIIFEENQIRVVSSHVDKDGNVGDAKDGFLYTPIEDPGPLFD